jgi:AraC family transcriptional regulator
MANPSIAIAGCRIELLPGAAYDVRYVPERPVVGFAFESQSGTHAFASDRMTAFRTLPNSLAYVPAGCDVASRSTDGGEYLSVTGLAIEGAPRFNDRIDRGAVAAARTLRRLLLAPGPVEPLAIERELAILDEAVGRTVASGSGRSTGWITPHRLRRIDEMIEAGLETGISVPAMAAALGLSPGFFHRAFRAAVGVTPHDYVIERRIARARRLLDTTRLGLAEIAAACGFASHAHMTAQLTARLGRPPSGLRG